MFFEKNANQFSHTMRDKFYESPPMDLEPLYYYTDEELVKDSGSDLIYDIECYPNYFLIAFKNSANNKVVKFDIFYDEDHGLIVDFNKSKLNWILSNFTCIAFNNRNYDDVMMFYALSIEQFTKDSLLQLKELSDRIVNEDDFTPYKFEEEYNIKIKESDRIDIMEVAPGPKISLKKYAGRLHAHRLWDLPYPPDMVLTFEQSQIVLSYCGNDLDNTILLYNSLTQELQLRRDMSDQYGIDLRSKSDAQIAEAVICSEIKKQTGRYPKKPNPRWGETFGYTPPSWLKFQTVGLQKFLLKVKTATYEIDGSGKVKIPEELKGGIKIGNMVYTFGNGGLHSTESKRGVVSDENYILLDQDVASYYPFIIINTELYPETLGERFLGVYTSIVHRRLAAKKNGEKVIAGSLKIVINGSFGKFGSPFSRLFGPNLLIQTTVTGQLALILLIETIELMGIEVLSANTDGIVIKCPRHRYDELKQVVKHWENQTKFTMEESQYKAVYSHSCNNYIAILSNDDKNGYKGKGYFAEPNLTKDPRIAICVKGCVELIINGKRIEDTIKNCQDIKQFCAIQEVKGGAEKDGIYLGKMVRWYYRKNEYGAIVRAGSKNKVAKSTGAWPLMTLPTVMPDDLDYQWYINEAYDMLKQIGYYSEQKQSSLF